MLIANPIYDVVFKYLMDDPEIARDFIAKIIGKKIIDIYVQSQENTTKSKKYTIAILRLDFVATIKTESGEHQKVLIELQKAKNHEHIFRFRKYLGINYLKTNKFTHKKRESTLNEAFSIITIYFLGFKLQNVPTSVVHIKRTYFDLMNKIEIKAKEHFIEQLTHDSFIIQIPYLETKTRNELEAVLGIFNQSYITKDKKMLELKEKPLSKNELLDKMIKRLESAATDEVLQNLIDLEQEVDNTIDRIIEEKDKTIQEKDKTIQEKDKTIQEKDKVIDKIKTEAKKREEEAKKIIEALKEQLKNRND